MHRIKARNYITITLGLMAFAEAVIFKGTEYLWPSLLPVIVGGVVIIALFNAAVGAGMPPK